MYAGGLYSHAGETIGSAPDVESPTVVVGFAQVEADGDAARVFAVSLPWICLKPNGVRADHASLSA